MSFIIALKLSLLGYLAILCRPLHRKHVNDLFVKYIA
ncbi:hypothetical protein KSS87_015652 [Heliosperma pusillum]|nr:hypothetical protein KSS87_015652 [Heliosperma pusillum]